MFLQPPQLELVVLKRLEQLQGLQNAPALGMLHCLTSVLQANNSAAGVEWSSTDGHEEGQQDHVQVDVSDAALSSQLVAWEAWLSVDGFIAKAHYYAATQALIQEVLNCTVVGGEVTVSGAALDAAWQEDSGSSDSATLPVERFRSSIAALATVSSSDGSPQTAATCLASVLAKLREGEQPQQRWLDLLEQYGAGKAGDAGGTLTAGPSGAATAGDDSDDDDLDALLGEDDGEAAGASGQASMPAAEAADASAGAATSGGHDAAAAGGGDAAEAAPEDDDDAFSLGISRAPSTSLSETADGDVTAGETSTAAQAAAAATAASTSRAVPARGISVKSVEDPELRRALSGASSADLDELPPEDLDAAVLRKGTHAKASTRAAKAAEGADGGKVHLSDLQTDLRSWAALKDKQREHQPYPGPAVPPKGRPAAVPAGGQASPMAPPPGGRVDVGKQATDQHLKGVRNPLHMAAFGDGVRQSMEHDRGSGAAGSFVSRHGSNASNDSPSRLVSNLSRKLSISEPGPVGPHAQWKHLPALGQASRLHPHEMRQPSYGVLRGAQSRGRAESGAMGSAAAALIDDKLPALPSLAGARGQPPKAMELLRRPSVIQRTDAHHADSGHPSPKGTLPGLGPNPKLQGARALCVGPKKSFRGDSNF